MSERLLLTILTDKTSWMNKYSNILKEKLVELGHIVKIIHSKRDLSKGNIAFFLSCFEIIPQSYLDLNEHNIVVHESNLPQGKGWSPLSWQILEGKNEIPIVLFEATTELDSGGIYYKDTIKLTGTELIDEWRDIQGRKTIEMCLRFVAEYKSIVPKKQSGKESFYMRRCPNDSELSIEKNLEQQFNLLRICDNERYPPFFYYKGERFVLTIKKDKENHR
jgi:methionyl-tRNA formyltransferase